MTQDSIREIFAQGLGDALKPRFLDQVKATAPDAGPVALNDNKRLKAAILDGIQNQPTQDQQRAAEAARKKKAALRAQILEALDIQNGN